MRDAQAQDIGNAVYQFVRILAGQGSDAAAHDYAKEKRVAHDAELSFHSFRVDVQLVKARNLVEQLVDDQRERHESLAERLRDGDAVHLVVVRLELLAGQVGHHHCDDVADDSGEESPPDVSGSEINHRPDEREVPIVPKVDVDGLGGFGQQHKDVDAQTYRNDERADGRVVRHGSCGGPSHVENLEAKPVDFGHFLQRVAQTARQQCGDHRKPYESDSHQKSAFQRFAELDADTNAQDGEQNGHHHGSSQPNDVTEYLFHVFLFSCLFNNGF